MNALSVAAVIMWLLVAWSLKYGDPRSAYMFLGAALASEVLARAD